MDWNNFCESVNDAAKRKIKGMVRRMSDAQLEYQYYYDSGERDWQIQEILEEEMRRRHLL